jgi:hypothetical protein
VRGLGKPGSGEEVDSISRARGPAGDVRFDLYLFTFVRDGPGFNISATLGGREPPEGGGEKENYCWFARGELDHWGIPPRAMYCMFALADDSCAMRSSS